MSSQFSSYSTEELVQKLKKQKRVLILQGVLIILMIVFAVFSTLEKGISFHSFLPLFFSPMFVAIYLDVRNIKKTIQSKTEK
jgi:hypothetical protein